MCRDVIKRIKARRVSVEPLLQIPSMVALHGHGGGVPAQGFHDGFFNRPGSFRSRACTIHPSEFPWRSRLIR